MIQYKRLLDRIIDDGFTTEAKKGNIRWLPNQMLNYSQAELEDFFSQYPVAKKKLEAELGLYMTGECNIEEYNKLGINWWDYCSPRLINSYPTYFSKLPLLLEQINSGRESKNYVLFIGQTALETNQLPCLSLIQFQLARYKGDARPHLYMTIYQRSADCNLGLPSDLYQMWAISKLIQFPLASIQFYIGNAHVYENNIEPTKEWLQTGIKPKYNLNV